MTPDNSNYYSREINLHYVSASQYKDFIGCLGRPGCEARAMATLAGEWATMPTTAMLVGSYVDSYIEGTLDEFMEQHPDIYLKNGNLKAEYRKAEDIIKFIEQDEFFMNYLSGQKQVIMTGEICGVPVKIKMDSYLPGKAVVDLKVMADLKKPNYIKDHGMMSFIDAWGYDLQLAIYREIVRQNTGDELLCFIAGVDKKEFPDHEIIWIENTKLDAAIIEVESNIGTIQAIKNGEREPVRCEECDYCRSTKKLTKAIASSELLG